MGKVALSNAVVYLTLCKYGWFKSVVAMKLSSAGATPNEENHSTHSAAETAFMGEGKITINALRESSLCPSAAHL